MEMLSSMYDLIMIESQNNRDTTDDSSIQFVDNVNRHILNGNSCESNSSSGNRKSKRSSSSNSSSNISSNRNQYMNDNDDRVYDHILIGSSIKRSKVSSNSTIRPIEKNGSDSSRNVVGSSITQQSTNELVCTVIEPIISNTIGSKKCVHSRQRSTCKDCGGSSICEHSRRRSQCKDCGGSGICEHSRVRSRCKDCGGSICEHSRVRSQCKDCGGSGICEHSRIKYRCKECKEYRLLV